MIRSVISYVPGARRFAAFLRNRQIAEVQDLVRKTFASKAVRFVQVGSNDGMHNDPIYAMSSSSDLWSGILIEPVPYLIERLKMNYNYADRFIFENVAIGRQPGKVPFYYVSDRAQHELSDLPEWHDQLGSFDKQHILKHGLAQIEPFIEVMNVEVCTLEQVLVRNKWHSIDLLHIDAEGYDWEVLSGVDLRTLNPEMVIIEHAHLSAADRELARRKLADGGYRVREIGGDFCAIRKGLSGQARPSARLNNREMAVTPSSDQCS